MHGSPPLPPSQAAVVAGRDQPVTSNPARWHRCRHRLSPTAPSPSRRHPPPCVHHPRSYRLQPLTVMKTTPYRGLCSIEAQPSCAFPPVILPLMLVSSRGPHGLKPAHAPPVSGNPCLQPCVPHVREEPGAHGKARETISVSFLRCKPFPMSSKTKRCAPKFLQRDDPVFQGRFRISALPWARTFAPFEPQGETQGFA